MKQESKSKEELLKELNEKVKDVATDLAMEILMTNKHLSQLLAMKCANDYMQEHGEDVSNLDKDVSPYSNKMVEDFIDHFVSFFVQ